MNTKVKEDIKSVEMDEDIGKQQCNDESGSGSCEGNRGNRQPRLNKARIITRKHWKIN